MPIVLDPPTMVATRDPVIKTELPLRSATKKLSVPLIRRKLMVPISIIPMKKKKTIARFTGFPPFEPLEITLSLSPKI
jgi:hypothetical protein